jgi:hypothetical protein
MSRIHAEATAIIDAPASEIYATLADYRDGHPHILPEKHFSAIQIEEGGIGEGTIFRVRVRALGVEQGYRMVVNEAEPGRMLTETDLDTGLITSFTVTPVQGEKKTQVRIATDWNASPGLRGVMERVVTPSMMRRIYSLELAQLASYMRTRNAAAAASVSPD